MSKKRIEKPKLLEEENISDSTVEEIKTEIEEEKTIDKTELEIPTKQEKIEDTGFVAFYLKPVGKWKRSGAYQGVLERRMKTISFIIPSNEIDTIERYKNIAKNGIPTEAELIRARILHG